MITTPERANPYNYTYLGVIYASMVPINKI